MSKSPYILRKGVSGLSDLRGGKAAFGLGVGNVYYVIKKTATYYSQFCDEYSVDYFDGSNSICPDTGTTTTDAAVALLNTGIQDALNKTVANRNDYVIVMPSETDYDIGAALTLSKKAVHLICPAALGNEYGCTNACRIHQLTAATPVFTVSAASVEIAGFYIKNYSKVTALELAQNAYAPNIHNNDFIMSLASTDSEPIIDNVVTGNVYNDGGGWGVIEYNWFVDGAGDASTVVPVLIRINAQATCARFCHNELTIGDGVTVTEGVANAAVKGRTDFNTFGTGGGDKDSTNGGTWTHCINLSPAGGAGSAIGNRATVGDGALVGGGTLDKTASDNMNAVDGGVVDDGD